jgi:predicted permease
VTILGVLAPNFLLVLLGISMRRWLGFGDGFWQDLERAVYYILFPALLFLAVARSGPAVLGTPGFIETEPPRVFRRLPGLSQAAIGS